MRVFLLCLLCKILFLKKYRPWESNNIIFTLPTDRPYFFAVFPVDQKINLVSPYKISFYFIYYHHETNNDLSLSNSNDLLILCPTEWICLLFHLYETVIMPKGTVFFIYYFESKKATGTWFLFKLDKTCVRKVSRNV